MLRMSYTYPTSYAYDIIQPYYTFSTVLYYNLNEKRFTVCCSLFALLPHVCYAVHIRLERYVLIFKLHFNVDTCLLNIVVRSKTI